MKKGQHPFSTAENKHRHKQTGSLILRKAEKLVQKEIGNDTEPRAADGSPEPAREISIIYSKNQLKVPVIESLTTIIESIMRGAIKFQNIKLITPTN